MVGLGGADGGAVRIAGVGEIDRQVAVAVGGRDAVAGAGHAAVGCDGQGRRHAIVHHRYGGAAVGRQVGRVQGHIGDCHAGRAFGIDFAAGEHAILVGVAGDDDGRRRRRTDVFDDAGTVAVGAVAVLIGLRGSDGGRVAVARIDEVHCDVAVAVGAGHAIGSTAHGAVGRDAQCRAHTIVNHRDGGTAVGRQAGRIQGHAGESHTGCRFASHIAAGKHAVVIGVAGNRDHRCRHADVLDRGRRIAARGVAVLIGLGGRYGDAIAVARIVERERDRAVAVAA